MPTLRARCFTELNDLNKPREDNGEYSKEEDYLPAGGDLDVVLVFRTWC